MNVIIYINHETGDRDAYGNFKECCECNNLSHNKYKARKFPIIIDDDIEICKLELKRGRRKNNKITPTNAD